MGRRIKRFRLWFSNHVPLPLLIVGMVAVVILCLNDDVSPSKSYSYLREIVALKNEIKLNKDSAAYYRQKSQDLTASPQDLEHIAREQYQMQKADEEVFIIK